MTTMQERLAETRRRLTLDAMSEVGGQLSDTSIRSVLGRIHSEHTDLADVRADMDFFARQGSGLGREAAACRTGGLGGQVHRVRPGGGARAQPRGHR